MIRNIYVQILCAVALAGCGGGSATYSAVSPAGHQLQSSYKTKPYKAPLINTALKRAYLQAINEARGSDRRCGSEGYFSATSDLRWSDALYKAAYEHSNDLAQTNTFEHRGSGRNSDYTREVLNLGQGSTFRERIENNGYTDVKAISENITAGTIRDTAQKAVDAWLKSDGHCANLMNPDFRDVGMAHVEKVGTTYKHYWTQNFGRTQ